LRTLADISARYSGHAARRGGQLVELAQLLEHLRGRAQPRVHAGGLAAERIEVRELAQRDRVLDAVARGLGHGQPAEEV
jgi:hypothetical protein